MKRKITAIILAVCLVMLLAAPAAEAAGDICFTGIESAVQPLDNNKMPAIINGLLYIPCAFFTSEELGVYYFSSSDKAILYYGSKQLIYDIQAGTVVDQDNSQHNIPAVKKGGRIYVPVDDVCRFFGLKYQVIQADKTGLAPVVRFYRGSIFINEDAFLDMNRDSMKTYYNDYIKANPGASVPSPDTSVTKNATLFLSFYDLSPANFEKVLDTLDKYRYKCSFFVSADEIAADGGLLRRAAGSGQTVGIWLKEGTYDEYQKAASLLFEATKTRSILVSAGGDASKTAEATAESKGLVFWAATKTYSGSDKITMGTVTGQLRAFDSSRVSINMACSDKNVSLLSSLLGYLEEENYIVKRITETTAPTYSIG